jgi:hypothetical protein
MRRWTFCLSYSKPSPRIEQISVSGQYNKIIRQFTYQEAKRGKIDFMLRFFFCVLYAAQILLALQFLFRLQAKLDETKKSGSFCYWGWECAPASPKACFAHKHRVQLRIIYCANTIGATLLFRFTYISRTCLLIGQGDGCRLG